MSGATAYQDTWSWAETPGASNEAKQIKQDGNDALYTMIATTTRVSAIHSELMSLVVERIDEVPGATLVKALEFAAMLPSDMELPEVSIDPDGELAFDWFKEEDLLSVSVGRTGRLTYAARLEGLPISGTVKLAGWLSSSLGEALKSFRYSTTRHAAANCSPG